MKEVQIGDVIPIYELQHHGNYDGLKGNNFSHQHCPQDIYGEDLTFVRDFIQLRVEFYQNDPPPVVFSGIFEQREVKPIGQMRIKKLK